MPGAGGKNPTWRSKRASRPSPWEAVVLAASVLALVGAARSASALAASDLPMARKALEGLFSALYEIGDLEGAKAALARLELLDAGPDREAVARFRRAAA